MNRKFKWKISNSTNEIVILYPRPFGSSSWNRLPIELSLPIFVPFQASFFPLLLSCRLSTVSGVFIYYVYLFAAFSCPYLVLLSCHISSPVPLQLCNSTHDIFYIVLCVMSSFPVWLLIDILNNTYSMTLCLSLLAVVAVVL